MAVAQATDNFDPNLSQSQQILDELRDLRPVIGKIQELKQEVELSNQKTDAFNQKFDTYQKATQWVVQLAFSLIAAATVTVIVSTVVGK